MNYQVNSTFFSGPIDLNDNIIIKSSKKEYEVFYRNKNIEDLLLEVYLENDFIFIDRNVYNLSPQLFINKKIFIFDAKEENKNIESSLLLIDFLHDNKFNKKNKLIVIGGGITQDVGGFASGIYKRGINWVLIPTTILAMTDSCIGSKVSINRKSKNMLGMFVAPNKIYISDFFLKTLSQDDIISGIGESFKLSLIGGKTTYDYFKEQYNAKNYINIIKTSSLIKKLLIEYDEFDENERKVLNYGHSVGHALECASNYFIPHGIAVLIGIYIKNKLFYDDKHKEINNFIIETVPSKFLQIEINYENFIGHLLSDKKNNSDKICFINLEEIGKTVFDYRKLEEIHESSKIVMSNLFKII